jgi:hypothetical protein
VPRGVSLRKVDLAVEMQILSFYQQRRVGPPVASVALDDEGVASAG